MSGWIVGKLRRGGKGDEGKIGRIMTGKCGVNKRKKVGNGEKWEDNMEN